MVAMLQLTAPAKTTNFVLMTYYDASLTSRLVKNI